MEVRFQHTCRLEPIAPYSFQFTLREVEWYPLDVTERVQNGALLRGFLLSENRPVLTVTKANDRGSLNTLVYALEPVSSDEVIAALTFTLNLDLDLLSWYHTISKDDPMHRIVEQLYGFKPLAKPSVFESLVSAILEQQLNVKFACTLETRLTQEYGTQLTSEAGTAWLFPVPETLADLEPNELRPMQISSSKARYIIDLARDIVSGELHPETWHELPDDELIRHLLTIRGVGRWTAEYVAMIGYRRFGHAPAADIGLRNAVTILTGSTERLSEEATRNYMSQWTTYRGLATLYIWHAFAVGII